MKPSTARLALCTLLTAIALQACGDDSSTDPAPITPAPVVDTSSLGKVVDVRDGHAYRTVEVGTQTWLGENVVWKPSSTSGWTCIDGKEDSCAKYGRHYTWVASMQLPDSCMSKSCSDRISTQQQGVCPSGWHIPTKDEWTALAKFVMDSTKLDKKHLPSAFRNASWKTPGTDPFHLAILPASSSTSPPISSAQVGTLARFWNATEYGAGYAYELDIVSDTTQPLEFVGDSKSLYASVRCVQNTP